MADIFLSYSSADRAKAKLLAGLLEQQGWSVWWDTTIRIGKPYASIIESELESAKAVIVLWSEESLKSQWVRNEANEAMLKAKLLPVLLENVSMPIAHRHLEAAQLFSWNGEDEHSELELLYKSIKEIAGEQKRIGPTKKDFPIHCVLLLLGAIILIIIVISYYLSMIQSENLALFDVKLFVSAFVVAIATWFICKESLDLLQHIRGNRLKKTSKMFLSSLISLLSLIGCILFLPRPKIFILTGQVITAEDYPIKDAQIGIDGSPFHTYSTTNGSFSLRIENCSRDTQVNVIITHNDFKDKQKLVRLNDYIVHQEPYTLQPLKP